MPTNFNIGDECCHRWAKSSADARRIALFFEDASGHRDVWTYERLGAATNQFANALTRMGVKPGDRVAIILAQSPEAVVAQLAAFSVGAVAMPLASNLTPKALEFRLRDSETRVAVVGAEAAGNLVGILSRCSKLTQVIGVGVDDDRLLPWRSLMTRQPEQFKPVLTRAEDPALLLYNSDTTHPARGTLLPHRALFGALPGFVAAQNWFPQGAEVFWTPLDWAHSSALLCAVLPTLYFGRALVGLRGATTPGQGPQLLNRYRVTHALMHSSVLKQIKMISTSEPAPQDKRLRSIAILDEGLDESLAIWCERHFGVRPNHLFGTTAMPALIGDSQQKWPGRHGSLGKAFPGHRLTLLNENGSQTRLGETGEIALNQLDRHGYPDPALPIKIWKADPTEIALDAEGWWRTGELAYIDADGYLWHAGRKNQLPNKRPPPPPAPVQINTTPPTE
ncbi:AMP-binding protein [Zwartia vadi]|uniref:AMP-binding protein n=1 Tax=Zwartia vadi TaxID=3058168 RepID=UPI0025B49F60|nr:AMP-binding protein [Zwartia vadi]MDN3987158.1 AMP-binding protein [Zwartia vadi]